MSKLERLKKIKTLRGGIEQSSANAIAKLKKSKLINATMAELGYGSATPAAATVEVKSPAVPTTKAARQSANDAAVQLLAEIEAGDVELPLTDAQKTILRGYTGKGGALTDSSTGRTGSAYEYYTPKEIAAGVWELLKDSGFEGGRVLDPSAGMGVFAETAGENTTVVQVELSAVSGKINALVNDKHQMTAGVPFERVAKNMPDESMDAIVTNVPFGTVTDRGANRFDDDKFQNEPLENYFILRSLQKLKGNGLAAYIVPTRVVSGKKAAAQSLRERASMMAEFVGAFRLPSHVFGGAGADVITDLIVFRKHTKENIWKIRAAFETKPAILRESNVMWAEFIDGKYFDLSGKRFVLGEFKPKDPSKLRDVDRVISNASVGEVGQLIRKLPKTDRIDWSLFDSVEAAPVQDGDARIIDGQLEKVQGGIAQLVVQPMMPQAAFEFILSHDTALKGFAAGLTREQAKGAVDSAINAGKYTIAPSWILRALQAKHDWRSVVVALAVDEAYYAHVDQPGFNYEAEFPALSEAMKSCAFKATNQPDIVQAALNLAAIHCDTKGNLSNVWRGQVQALADIELTDVQKFEAAKYAEKSIYISAEAAKEAGIDALTDDRFMIDLNGRVARADDVFVGFAGKVLDDLDEMIAAEMDDAKRAKLVRMRSIAESRITKIDVRRMNLSLDSPFIDAWTKQRFFQSFKGWQSKVTSSNGKTYVQVEPSSVKSSELGAVNIGEFDASKIIKAYNVWLERSTVTLKGQKFDVEKLDALRSLQAIITKTNGQFEMWVRSRPEILEAMDAKVNSRENLKFNRVDDESPIEIDGLSTDRTLHGYQAAFVRRMALGFSGINGFNVGLGKTMTALASVQHVQNIGVKKKTIFVVPNSVLSNWRKEAASTYTSTDDCLFVGLRQNRAGKMVAQSKYYDADLNTVLENRHRKIFMTMEAFERIKLQESTISEYVDLQRDNSLTEDKAIERQESRLKALEKSLSGKSSAAPYLEQMGVDSIVIDEAHNCITTRDFDGAKGLSIAPVARRAADMMAKTWYLRGSTDTKDGVLLLTATPITNSPLEIYSMLSLASGEENVRRATSVRNVDDFMQAVTQIVNEEALSLDGEPKQMDVFKGLKNVDLIRSAIGEFAVIKDAEDVGAQIVVPDQEDSISDIHGDPEIVSRVDLYKRAYRYASAAIKGQPVNHEYAGAYEEVLSMFDEAPGTIGHPFNLLIKMSSAHLDPDLDLGRTLYVAENDQQANVLATEWNKLGVSEWRVRRGYMTTDGDILHKKIDENTDKIKEMEISVRAVADGKNVYVNTVNPDLQNKFEALAEKLGSDLDITMSPKIAAMVENFRKEEMNPRGIDADGEQSSVVRQLIFCDSLGVHNKIKRALAKRCGVSSSQIAIVTGSINGTTNEIQAVQDGFNGTGDDNAYRVIIANEKAEVGINLQKGTQAIHHLTIGWTPDSLTQRNGRGVRQGNLTESVNVYHYDIDGSFDKAKRELVNGKAEWIGQVLQKGGDNMIASEGSLTVEQMEQLIDATGSAEEIAAAQAAIKAREAERRLKASLDARRDAAAVIVSQKNIVSEYENSDRALLVNEILRWKGIMNASRKAQVDYEKAGAGTKRKETLQMIAEQAKQTADDATQYLIDNMVSLRAVQDIYKHKRNFLSEVDYVEADAHDVWRVCARYGMGNGERFKTEQESIVASAKSMIASAKESIRQAGASDEEVEVWASKREGSDFVVNAEGRMIAEGSAFQLDGYFCVVQDIGSSRVTFKRINLADATIDPSSVHLTHAEIKPAVNVRKELTEADEILIARAYDKYATEVDASNSVKYVFADFPGDWKRFAKHVPVDYVKKGQVRFTDGGFPFVVNKDAEYLKAFIRPEVFEGEKEGKIVLRENIMRRAQFSPNRKADMAEIIAFLADYPLPINIDAVLNEIPFLRESGFTNTEVVRAFMREMERRVAEETGASLDAIETVESREQMAGIIARYEHDIRAAITGQMEQFDSSINAGFTPLDLQGKFSESTFERIKAVFNKVREMEEKRAKEEREADQARAIKEMSENPRMPVYISGNTFAHKEKIKQIGAKFPLEGSRYGADIYKNSAGQFFWKVSIEAWTHLHSLNGLEMTPIKPR